MDLLTLGMMKNLGGATSWDDLFDIIIKAEDDFKNATGSSPICNYSIEKITYDDVKAKLLNGEIVGACIVYHRIESDMEKWAVLNDCQIEYNIYSNDWKGLAVYNPTVAMSYIWIGEDGNIMQD